MYYDREGKKITMKEMVELRCSIKDYHVVERSLVTSKLGPALLVSTIWLGLDHSFNSDVPLIFETMVFMVNDKGDISNWSELYSDRYSTIEEARAGHKEACRLVECGLILSIPADEEGDTVDFKINISKKT